MREKSHDDRDNKREKSKDDKRTMRANHKPRDSKRDDDGDVNDVDGGIDLTTNGRLFPTWLTNHFKRFKLPEIMIDPDEDPCKPTGVKGGYELRKYQQFVGEYMNYKSKHKSMLLYHLMGSGKTATIINLYNVLYHHSPQWNVFILIRAALRDDPWMKELKEWMKGDDVKDMYSNIHFVHYDSPFAGRDFMDEVRRSDTSKQNLYVVDEAHNFILNVYSNVTTHKGSRAQTIYDYIQQDKKENDSTRVIVMSGTPAVNSPFELALIYNLLRPGIFPKSEAEFNEHFLSSSGVTALDPTKRNQFQRLILGLTSYYIGTTPDTHATSTINPIVLSMARYQQEVYRHFEEMESRAAMKSSGSGSMYRTYTRQACNFVFPDIDHKVSGMKRPRPSNFRLTLREAQKLMEGRTDELKLTNDGDKFMDVSNYLNTMTEYVDRTRKWFENIADDDAKIGLTLKDDFKMYSEKYKGRFKKFYDSKEPKSALFTAMYQCSPKMICILFSALRSPGPTVVYSGFVKMEGHEMFKMYMDLAGFSLWKEGDTNTLTYGEFTGDRPREERLIYKDVFNAPGNIRGANMKVILFSPAGVEGVSLRNVREIHIMEAHWHEVRITQMIGRGIRQCSHKDLPMKDRHVDIFRYTMKRESGKETTDQYIAGIARAKDTMIQSFLEAVRETSIDCTLNAAHNKMSSDYKCFQFEEESLFEKNPGPAFKYDLYDNAKIDNGSNSVNSMVKRIKAMKIKAVKKIGEEKYGQPKDYWWCPESSVIYDYEMKIPLAKISVDPVNKLPLKSGENYIIGQIIQGIEL
jgi:hypothetical protein